MKYEQPIGDQRPKQNPIAFAKKIILVQVEFLKKSGNSEEWYQENAALFRVLSEIDDVFKTAIMEDDFDELTRRLNQAKEDPQVAELSRADKRDELKKYLQDKRDGA